MPRLIAALLLALALSLAVAPSVPAEEGHAPAKRPLCRLVLQGFDRTALDPALERLCKTPGLACRKLLVYESKSVVLAMDCPKGPAMLRHQVAEALVASGFKDLYLEAEEDRLLVLPADQAPPHHHEPNHHQTHPENPQP